LGSILFFSPDGFCPDERLLGQGEDGSWDTFLLVQLAPSFLAKELRAKEKVKPCSQRRRGVWIKLSPRNLATLPPR
jgi:hypothetical protein